VAGISILGGSKIENDEYASQKNILKVVAEASQYYQIMIIISMTSNRKMHFLLTRTVMRVMQLIRGMILTIFRKVLVCA
jgi:hypothetical protein